MSWDGDALFYSSISGGTSRLLEPAGEVLRLFAAKENTTAMTIDELSSRLHIADETRRTHLEETLDILCLIGLLKREPVEGSRSLKAGA